MVSNHGAAARVLCLVCALHLYAASAEPLPPLTTQDVIGQFSWQNPASLGQVWRFNRDPQTCKSVLQQAKRYQTSANDLLDLLRQEEAVDINKRSAQWVVPIELAIIDSMALDDRHAEAEFFVQQRLAKTIVVTAPNSADYWTPKTEKQRRQALLEKLAELTTSQYPAKAEQLYLQSLAEKSEDYRKLFQSQVHGVAQDSSLWQFYARDFARQVAADKATTLAPFYRRVGRYQESLQLYQAALTQFQIGRNQLSPEEQRRNGLYEREIKSLQIEVSLTQAEIARSEGRHGAAEALYRQCCAISAKEQAVKFDAALNPLRVEGLTRFARMILAQGRRAEAGVLASRLRLDLSQDIEHEFACMALPPDSNRGEHESFTADPLTQLISLTQTGQLLARGTELGELLSHSGLLDDAQQVLQTTLGLQQTIFGASHPSALQTLQTLARVEQGRGNRTRSNALWSAWLTQSNAFLTDRLWNVGEDARRSFLQHDRKGVAHFLTNLRANGQANAAEQALALSLSRKGLLTRIAGDINRITRGQKDPSTQPLVAALIQQRHALALLSLRGGANDAALAHAREQLQQLETELTRKARPGKSSGSLPTTTQILDRLGPGEALVDFLVYHETLNETGGDAAQKTKEQMIAIVARKPGGITLVRWNDLEPLRAAVLKHRRAILAQTIMQDSSEAEQQVAKTSQALYQILWAPLTAALGNATFVYVVPDGILNLAPFAALKTPQGAYLVERLQLAKLGSARDLLDTASGSRQKHSTVLGAPDYGLPANAPPRLRGVSPTRSRTVAHKLSEMLFAPLPGALEEAKEVASILSASYDNKLLTGSQATKSALLKEKSPAVLHLATHGFFLDDTPPASDGGDPLQALARSGLALTNANLTLQKDRSNTADDGILTALEATAIDLSATELVVLSACDSGLGQISTGEGLYGLARAFQEAGARDVLATLWPIADQVTRLFMQDFYRRLAHGEQPRQALRATQLAFIKSAKWQAPIYWAPFVLTGK